MKLYDYVLSTDCYKVRLFAGLLGVQYDAVPVDVYPGQENKSPKFLERSPQGKVPVLVEDDFVLDDPHAILLYIAREHDRDRHWWPVGDTRASSRVVQWLSFANELNHTIGASRLHSMLGGQGIDVAQTRSDAERQITVLDDYLTDREFEGSAWLVGAKPTVADIACFPCVAVAGDGGIDVSPFRAVGRWLKNVISLEGFTPMPGVSAVR
ncbi:MAG: glutathione S-transferase [Leifsonia xyli]|jgi:glutathione S-transferase|nr:MAG: glutathione S-transferase [Leifsonia xyli]